MNIFLRDAKLMNKFIPDIQSVIFECIQQSTGLFTVQYSLYP